MSSPDIGPIFAHRETGVLCRVKNVDDSYAYYEVFGSDEPGMTGQSAYSMPKAEYDEHFAEMWRPATEEDLLALPRPDGFRPPLNTSDW